MQVCEFRDRLQGFQGLGYAVYGISRDPPQISQAFKLKNHLPYGLICDQQGTVLDHLGLLAPSNGLTIRSMIAINKAGRVLSSFAGDETHVNVHSTISILKAMQSVAMTPSREFGTPGQEHSKSSGYFEQVVGNEKVSSPSTLD